MFKYFLIPVLVSFFVNIVFMISLNSTDNVDIKKSMDSCFYKVKLNAEHPESITINYADSYTLKTTNRNILISVISVSAKNMLGETKTAEVSCTTHKINGNTETGRMIMLDDPK